MVDAYWDDMNISKKKSILDWFQKIVHTTPWVIFCNSENGTFTKTKIKVKLLNLNMFKINFDVLFLFEKTDPFP